MMINLNPDEEKKTIDELLSPLLIRLAKLLANHYNCRLEHNQIPIAMENTLSPQANTAVRSKKAQYSSTEISFPLVLNHHVKGLLSLFPLSELTTIPDQKIAVLLDLVVTPSLNSIQRILALKALENNFLSDISQNKISGADSKSAIADPYIQPLNLDVQLKTQLSKAKSSQRDFLSSLLIEADNSQDILKLALKLHAKLKRSSFITVSNQNSDIFLNFDFLDQMGPITIFIPEISEIPVMQQKYILNYLRRTLSPQVPQIIIGSALFRYSELTSLQGLIPNFIKKISLGYFNLTSCQDENEMLRQMDFFQYDQSAKNLTRVLM